MWTKPHFHEKENRHHSSLSKRPSKKLGIGVLFLRLNIDEILWRKGSKHSQRNANRDFNAQLSICKLSPEMVRNFQKTVEGILKLSCAFYWTPLLTSRAPITAFTLNHTLLQQLPTYLKVQWTEFNMRVVHAWFAILLIKENFRNLKRSFNLIHMSIFRSTMFFLLEFPPGFQSFFSV